jgi:GABA(A) receptor-associated protein
MIQPFKEKHPFEKRKTEAWNIRAKYPERVPVIVEKSLNSDIVNIDKNKFLAPCELTVGQFMFIIRRRMKLPPEKALFVFVKNHIPMQSLLISTLYDDCADADGFLYMTYAGENTFGEN